MKSHRGRITNKKAFRVAARRYLQVRAEELKNLEEKRAALVEEMEGILNKAQEEERAFEESEQVRFDEIEKEINAIDKTIEAKERARNLGNPGGKKKEDGENDNLTVEERAFVDYVRGTLTNERAANLTYADNGAVIPSSIVNKIIEKVVEICPIYSMADRYNIGGTINIPYYDEETSSIKMAYADEFTELTSTSGNFGSISLGGFLAGALTLISKKLINNSNFDVLNKIIQYTLLSDLDPITFVEGFEWGKILKCRLQGKDQEDTELYRSRVLNSYNYRGFAGNREYYKGRINEMPGVKACKLERVSKPDDQIKVMIAGDSFRTPDEDVVKEVQNTVDPVVTSGEGDGIAPIGHRVKVVGAEEETVNINTEITFESGYAYEDIKEYINQAVEEYFLEVREKWEKNDNLVVRILQVERAIVDVTGVEDVAGTTLNRAAKNYTVGKNKLPVKGELTCTSK